MSRGKRRPILLSFEDREVVSLADTSRSSSSGRVGAPRELPLGDELVAGLAALGVERAFGAHSSAVTPIFEALETNPAITLHHFRRESAAALAAAAAGFTSGRPAVVFAAAGAGTLRALFGLAAARHDGAKVLLLTSALGGGRRGVWTAGAGAAEGTAQAEPIFHWSHRIEHPAELPEVLERLRSGWARPQGFVAHLAVPADLHSRPVAAGPRRGAAPPLCCDAPPATAATCVRLLSEGPFAVWAGFGVRGATAELRQLIERTGARVFCSPRAKGVVAEDHPLYLGVTGAGGHEAVLDYMTREKPRWVLVLGSRLGEATSLWDHDMRPGAGFIHVDLDPEVPGAAYPEVPTVGIQAEIGTFLRHLLRLLPQGGSSRPRPVFTRRLDEPITLPRRDRDGVRPRVLFQAIQRRVIEAGKAPFFCETSLFAWANRHLRFEDPHRYCVSTFFGCRGQAVAGALGAALARGERAFAVVDATALLAESEISTAVRYGAPVVWIVVDPGDEARREAPGCKPAMGDVLALARAADAAGVAVRREDELDEAFAIAAKTPGPFLIDVALDASEPSPLAQRLASLSWG